MTRLDEIKAVLNTINDKLLRIENYVNNYNTNGGTVSRLEARQQILEGIRKEFEQSQYEYETLDAKNEGSKDRHRESRIHFEDKYCDIMADILDIIKEQKASQINANSTPSISSHNVNIQNKNNSLNLPTINIKTYSGHYKDWTNFENSFQSIIGENKTLDNRQKLQYLKSCLSHEAARAIGSLSINEENYDKAWEILKNRFQNMRLIVQDHVFTILSIPIINKQSSGALRELLDTLITNMEALKTLNIPVNSWDALIIPIINEKLDYNTKKEWQMTLHSNIPTYGEFIKFLERRCTMLESLNNISSKFSNQVNNNSNISNQSHSNKRNVTMTTTNSGNSKLCVVCKGPHLIYHCTDFLNLTVQAKNDKVKNLKLCINCLRNNHTLATCRSNNKCKHCAKKHNTILHAENRREESDAPETAITINNYGNHHVETLLATATILIKNSRNYYSPCRALLDPGSTSSYITKETCERLSINLIPEKFQIRSLNGAISTAAHSVLINIKSSVNAWTSNKVKCIVVNKITERLPLISINLADLNIPKNVLENLADKSFGKTNKIDILLGSDLFWSLLSIGQIKLPSGLVFQKTQLGFIAAGPYFQGNHKQTSVSNTNALCNLGIDNNLNERVSKFWELEEAGIRPLNKNLWTEEDFKTEMHFKKSTGRNSEGRFIVSLPLKNNKLDVGESKEIALKRFYGLENRLLRNKQLHKDYSEFMREYIDLKHMILIDNSLSLNGLYLPHHPVFKKDSMGSKIRIVFDASAKTSNQLSLNDNLLKGPIIQRDLFAIILDFRIFKYVISADVTKMYRQILLDPVDKKHHLIFWRNHPRENLQTYQLETLTYGTKPASFIATRCLQELSETNKDEFPAAANVIKNHFYMDDLLAGANSIKDLIKIRDDVIFILKQAQFELRKFQSNEVQVLPIDNIDESTLQVRLNKDEHMKVLGLFWNPNSDNLNYKIDLGEIPEKVTKRTILSLTAQIFDPLGLIGPVIMKAKVILQHLWGLKLSWDEAVPMSIHTVWSKMLSEIKKLNCLAIPRLIVDCSCNEIELHGFSDGSQLGYGAAVYLRSMDNNGKYQTRLMCSKSRVAPIKTISLPRIELCGCLLLARLISKIKNSESIKFTKQFLWTDSSIVLAWLNTSPNTLKVFVANRVSEIVNLTSVNDWHHVSSKNNAADIISRGAFPSELVKNKSWFNGPQFLEKPISMWPKSNLNIKQVEILEARPSQTLCHISIDNTLFNKFASFKKLQRTLAWALRFVNNCRTKNKLISPTLCTQELDTSLKKIVQLVQREEFYKELEALKNSKDVSSNSKILSLNPFLDNEHIIRVGGRLKNATVNVDAKHPMMLPKNHIISKLIIKFVHEQQLHAGPEGTLAAIRRRFWILSGRSAVRQVLHSCYSCFRANPKPAQFKMGNLPANRVQPARPFCNVGVDYAGPVYVKEIKGRGKKIIKAYIALFVCFSTKAVHIELACDLTTQEFVAALKRFISRRGFPLNIYSDNGRNFVGAKNEITSIINFLKNQNNQSVIINEAANLGSQWHFIPPNSPHMGGLWESNVKSVKNHLKRVIGNVRLTFNEMNTLLIQIEACLNARPLTPLSSNPNDLEAITPFHFLIGETHQSLAERDYSQVPINRLSRYHLIEKLKAHFYKRWSREYLSSLQNRSKWKKTSTKANLIGKLVILIEENAPPLTWRLGRITETHEGNDGDVRVVSVKTKNGTLKRTLKKVCIVPQEQQSSSV